ncbi:MAG: site-specific DNA-methyltransferase [bacterium]|nr:site-specific DNA-methyltransferase [bacterium]
MRDLLEGLPESGPTRPNQLFYGDNLTIMRKLPSACVDLLYLDPPFNSQRTYNLIYRKATGAPVPEQEEAFCDAWELDEEKQEMVRSMPIVLRRHGVDHDLVRFWDAWISALRNTQPRMLAYLVYMTFRLLEMRSLLKPTGSLYLHCDPTASHYMKVILDGLFGHANFRNEVIWKRTFSHGSARRWGDVHDVLLFYTKSDRYTWNRVLQAHAPGYVAEKYRQSDARGRYQLVVLTGPGTTNGPSGQPWRGYDPTTAGRHWVVPRAGLAELRADGIDVPDELHAQLDLLYEHGFIVFPRKRGGTGIPRFKLHLPEGQSAQDVILDVPPINSQAKERLGFPTQKPIALLKRIIQASSNEGDYVFDPFCGCGSAIYAAQELGRRWIGCDIAILSVQLVRDVLRKRYGLEEGRDYEMTGVPRSVEAARELFRHEPLQFQHWAVELAGGFCSTRLSGDRGVDGRIYFETSSGLKHMVLSVKGGKLSPAIVRELAGTIGGQQGAMLGGLVCLNEPTRGMREAAGSAGMCDYLGIAYPRLQIRTIGDLLGKQAFSTPSRVQTLDWERQIRLPF